MSQPATDYRKLDREQIKRLIVGLYDDARRYHWASGELHERMQVKVWSELDSRTEGGRRRYTNETKGFAEGVTKMVDDALWKDLVYVHLLDGVINPSGQIESGLVFSDDRRAHGVNRGTVDFGPDKQVTGRSIRVWTFDYLLAELDKRNEGKPYALHLGVSDVIAATVWQGSLKPFTKWGLPWSAERDPEWLSRQPKAVQDRVNAAIKNKQLALNESKGDE